MYSIVAKRNFVLFIPVLGKHNLTVVQILQYSLLILYCSSNIAVQFTHPVL